MFCNRCGTELADGTRFCHNCGKEIKIRSTQSDGSASGQAAGKTARRPVNKSVNRPVNKPVNKSADNPSHTTGRVKLPKAKPPRNPLMPLMITVGIAITVGVCVCGVLVLKIDINNSEKENTRIEQAEKTEDAGESMQAENTANDQMQPAAAEEAEKDLEDQQIAGEDKKEADNKIDSTDMGEYVRLYNEWLAGKKEEGLVPDEGANYITVINMNGKIRVICDLVYEGEIYGIGYILAFDNGSVKEKYFDIYRCYAHEVVPKGYFVYCGSGGAGVYGIEMINLDDLESDYIDVNNEQEQPQYSVGDSQLSEEEAIQYVRARLGNEFEEFKYFSDDETLVPGWPWKTLPKYMRIEDALNYQFDFNTN